MTVSTGPLEWRSRLRAIARARPVVFNGRDIGRSPLLMREQLKGLPQKRTREHAVSPVHIRPAQDGCRQ